VLLEQPVGELAREADLVVTAYVAAADPRVTADGGSLETEVRLEVEGAWKGAPGPRLTLVVPGGALGDVRVLVGGMPTFWPDQRVLLFLSGRAGRLSLTGLWQGRYALAGDRAIQPETGRVVPLGRLAARVADALASPGVGGEEDPPSHAAPRFTTFCLPWQPAQVPVRFWVNPAAGGGALTRRQVRVALQGWQDVPGAWVAGRVAGTTTRPGTDHLDGVSDVAWADLDWLGPRVLAANFCTMVGPERLEADTLLDATGPTWSVTAEPGAVDLPSVVQHELGHALGLGHRYLDCDTTAATPLMCPSIATGVRKPIQADDVAGLVSLYPLAGAPPETPPVVSASLAGSAAVTLAWRPGAALAYEVQRATGSCAGPFEPLDTLPGTASSYRDDDAEAGLPPGPYCYRLKALGLGGDAPPSPPAPITLPSAAHAGLFVAVAGPGAAAGGTLVTGVGAGGPPLVRAFGVDGTPRGPEVFAYDAGFTGGVRVATCDLDGDGRPELVTGAGPGGSPHVRVLALDAAGAPAAERASVLAYPAGFTGGVFVACGDVDGDGVPEIVTGAGRGGSPHVRVFRIAAGIPGGLTPLVDFFPFDPEFAGGARVAVGRLEGDRDAIVVGAGPGGGAHVRAIVLRDGAPRDLASFLAYPAGFLVGVFVAAGPVSGAGPVIVTGADAGGGPHVRVFSATGAPVGDGFLAYTDAFAGGVRVAVGDAGGVGRGAVVTAPGPGGAPHVRVLGATGSPRATSFLAY
jgi:hypothetical protein